MIAKNIARTNGKSNPHQTRLTLMQAYLKMKREHGQELNGRAGRAYRIIQDGKISQIDANTWLIIPSTPGRPPYIVTFHTQWQCNCPDCAEYGNAPIIWLFGSYGPVCKHIIAAALGWLAEVEFPQVTIPQTETKSAFAPAPARINGRGRGRRRTCDVCQVDIQECDCPAPDKEPSRITTPDNIEKPLTVEEQERAAWNSLGIKQEAGRGTSASFENIQRW